MTVMDVFTVKPSPFKVWVGQQQTKIFLSLARSTCLFQTKKLFQKYIQSFNFLQLFINNISAITELLYEHLIITYPIPTIFSHCPDIPDDKFPWDINTPEKKKDKT
jgi:hypothetical protein